MQKLKKYVNFKSPISKKSTLDGYNYGEYPNHDFYYIYDNVPLYPVFINFCGYDIWHKECLRKRTFSDTFAIEYIQKGGVLFQQNNIKMRVNPGAYFTPSASTIFVFILISTYGKDNISNHLTRAVRLA